MKILLVDDEPDVRMLLQSALGYAHSDMQIREAADGDAALQILATTTPDLVLRDVSMPRRDGFSVLEELRRTSNLPVIMLTARGLEAGRLTASSSARTTTSRSRSAPVSSWPGWAACSGVPAHGSRDRVSSSGAASGWTWRPAGHRDAREVRLSETEFNLLVELKTRAGSAVPTETLLSKVWGAEYVRETNYVKVYVGRLRERLEANPAEPLLIQTVRGVGYRFA